MSAAPAMACIEFVERVNDYLEGLLTDLDRVRLEEHLAVCPHCVHYLDQIRVVRRGAGRLEADEIPEHVREDLLRAFGRWSDERPV